MELFFHLLMHLLPLYVLIGMGFVAGRILKTDRMTLANLLIFLFVPVVAFGYVAQLEFRPEYLLLPFVVFGLQTIVGLAFLLLGKYVYRDKRANLMAMCVSHGNVGYFGLPLVLILFEPQWVAVYMFSLVGVSVYEATIAYYLAVRGQFNVPESIGKLVRFPTLYAIAAGLAVNISGFGLPDVFVTYWEYFKGCFVILGMMIIGTALAHMNRLEMRPRFLGLSFLGKFVVFPVITVLFTVLDRGVLHWFNEDIYALLIVMSLMPPGANIVAYAAQLDLKPEKAATTIFIGTLFALVYIPLVLVLGGIY